MAQPIRIGVSEFLTRVIAPVFRAHGYFRSLSGKLAVGEGGDPLPMYTYPAIEYLAAPDFRTARVLEFGSGQSTLWWAKRAARICAVEHDDHWVARLRQAGLGNLDIVFARREDIRTGAAYLATVPRDRPYDVIALDGLHYYDCAAAVPGLLSEGGIVVFDNADYYPRTTALLRAADLIQVDFAGFKPTHTDCQVTSLFLRPGFRPRPRGRALPPTPVGGKGQVSIFDQPRTIRADDANRPIIE